MRFIVVPIFSETRTTYAVKDAVTGKLRHRYRGADAQQKATSKAAALNAALRSGVVPNGERGSVFFTLFAAVALVGVLGTAVHMTVRGPLSAAANLNMTVRTDSRLMLAGRLAAQAAAVSATDCDGDGLAEPLPPAMGPECAAAGGAGGGCIPVTVGSEKADPWGSPVMYCAYDHGTGTTGCAAGLRTGEANPTGKPVLAVVSAGPDRVFQSSCANAPGYVTRGGDDRAYIFDQAEAVAAGAGGGLWSLVSGDPNTATIDKDITVTTGATFGGDVFFSSSSNLTLGGSFLLPDDSAMTICNGANKGALRVHDASANVQVCNGAGQWLAVGNRNLGALDDVPDSYAGAAGAFLRVRGDETGIRFGSAATLDLADWPGTYAGQAGRFLRVRGDESGLRYGSAALLDLADAPGSYAGAAGWPVKVKADESGIEFVDPATPDCPAIGDVCADGSIYAGISADGGGRMFMIASPLSGTQYGPDVGPLAVCPSAGNAARVCRAGAANTQAMAQPGYIANLCMNATAHGKTDWYLPALDELITARPATGGEFYPTSSRHGAASLWVVGPASVVGMAANSSGDMVCFRKDAPAALGFLELHDTPDAYAGAANHALVVNGGGNGLSFVSSSMFVGPQGPQGTQGVQGVQGPQGPAGPPGSNAPDNFLALTDTPNAYTAQGGKVVKVNAGATALEFADDANTTTFLALTDTPNAYTGQAGKLVKVNPAANAVEFGGLAFTNLSDAPASLAGQGGKVVKVNAGATALEFGPAGGVFACATVVATNTARATASCGAGYSLTGGGCRFGNAPAANSFMTPGGMGGTGDFYYDNTTTANDYFCQNTGGSVTAYARCCQIQ